MFFPESMLASALSTLGYEIPCVNILLRLRSNLTVWETLLRQIELQTLPVSRRQAPPCVPDNCNRLCTARRDNTVHFHIHLGFRDFGVKSLEHNFPPVPSWIRCPCFTAQKLVRNIG